MAWFGRVVLWALCCFHMPFPVTANTCPSGQASVRISYPVTTVTTSTSTSTVEASPSPSSPSPSPPSPSSPSPSPSSGDADGDGDSDGDGDGDGDGDFLGEAGVTRLSTIYGDGGGSGNDLKRPAYTTCSLIPDVCYREEDWLPDRVVQVSCANDSWPNISDSAHLSQCSCLKGDIGYDALYAPVNPDECRVDMVQAAPGTPYTSWCHGYHVPVRRDYTCQEVVVRHMQMLLNLSHPRPVASAGFCNSSLNMTDSREQHIHEFYHDLVRMGCCGTAEGYEFLSACDKVHHPEIQSKTFQVNLCQDVNDFTPEALWEVDCIGITTAQCEDLGGSRAVDSSSCNDRPPCKLEGFPDQNLSALCISLGGTLSEGLSCRNFYDRYVLPSFVSFDSKGFWERATCLEKVDDLTGNYMVQDRVRYAGLRCCRSMQTQCPRIHGMMMYSNAGCQIADVDGFSTTWHYNLPQYAWDYGQCAPASRSVVGDYVLALTPVYFRAQCTANYHLELQIYDDDRCKLEVDRIALDAGNTELLLGGDCAQAMFDDSVVQLQFTVAQAPFWPHCGAPQVCTCDPPELKPGSGAAQQFSGFINVPNYGCSGSAHYVELQQALDACRSRSDCTGVQNTGCNMQVAGGVYTLCSTGQMYCCKDDCAYVKVPP